MAIRKVILVLFSSISLTFCEGMFEYSPYLIDFNEDNRNVNQKNILKVTNQVQDDTITIAFTGDCPMKSDIIKCNDWRSSIMFKSKLIKPGKEICGALLVFKSSTKRLKYNLCGAIVVQ